MVNPGEKKLSNDRTTEVTENTEQNLQGGKEKTLEAIGSTTVEKFASLFLLYSL
jgi:hypothetical protein